MVTGGAADRAMLEDLRQRERYDWRQVFSFRTKENAAHEQPWFCFLCGENPDYPEQIRQDRTENQHNHIHWWQE